MRARSTFQITGWEEKPYDERDGGARLTRASVTKAFHGDIEGSGAIEYLMFYRADGTASYVGLERIEGSVGGHAGSFVLEHRGVYEDGVATLHFSVIPGSGTGALTGLRGQGAFTAGHEEKYAMTMEYELA